MSNPSWPGSHIDAHFPLHPADAERLELLELLATSEGEDLELLLAESHEITLKIIACRERFAKAVRDRDTFKSALAGMGVELK